MKKKKRICMALAAALSMSLAISATALAAIPSDIGGHWAQGTIIQWTSNGYIAGYPDGTFKPDNSITRAEFVVLVNKAMGYNDRGNAYFSDVSASHWAYAEIMKGVEAGYITGNGDGTFRPDAPVTRQEAAVMISKILGLGQDFASAAKYADYRYIPSWAAGYVGAVTNAGIMSGYPDRDFKADRVLTRAEAVISLDKTMNYDNKTEEDDREVFEDYRLTSTSLSDKIIKGDLIISSTLSSRDVSLDNVKVEGKLIVDGGKTITADDCEINELEMSKNDAEFVAEGKTTVKETNFEKYGKLVGSGYSKVIIDNEFNSYIELDAEIDYVELDAETNVRLLSDCVIETFEATGNADNATVNFSSAEVEDMDIYDAIRITGKGDIKNMTVYKSGVKSSIRPDDLNTRNGASKPDYTSTSSGDIGYNSGSRYDDLTASRDNRTYRGGRYDDVKVTGKDVTLENMTIYGDLTIDEDVRNSDVTIDNVTIKGKVYIEGGGDSTVGFYDCEIEGNIYARKDYGTTPVGIEFEDSYSAEHFDGTLVIEKNGAIVKGAGKLDNVYVDTDEKVDIDINVKNLYVREKTSKLTITAGTTVDKLSISSSSAKNSTITNDGTINELNTSQNITVNGSGTINNTNTTGNGTVTTGEGQKISVTGVTLNKTTATVEAGNTYKLTATVQPTNATNNKVTWSSDKTDIATVDANGLVTAKAAGTANITVTTEDGSKTATCVVTVKEKPAETVPAESVTLDKETLELTVGGRGTLEATVTPSNTTDTLSWTTSDNDGVVEVTSGKNGTATVKALKAGTANVIVSAGNYSDTCTVTVNPETVAVESVSLSERSFSLEEGDSKTLTATVNPENATNKTVTWTSSDASVATVDANGNVKGVKAGTANITVTTEDGSKKATCAVTVIAKKVDTVMITGVEGDSPTLSVGGTLNLSATVEPDEAANKELEWTSSNPDVATVSENENGVIVTAVGEGSTTITATAKDGSNASDSITVTVNPVEVASVSITKDETVTSYETLNKDETLQLMATVEPDNATNSDVTWSSNNTGVATVNENGLVTAVGGGTATITATAGGKSAECQITVNVPVTGVTIAAPKGTQGGTSENPAIMTSGGTLQLMATVEPDNATNSDVTWSSNNTGVATVSNGLVTAGSVTESKTVTITATVGGKSATFTITVNPAAVPGTDSGTTTPGGVTDTIPGTGTGNEGQTVTGGGSQTPGKTTTTTQATSNAIVVSR